MLSLLVIRLLWITVAHKISYFTKITSECWLVLTCLFMINVVYNFGDFREYYFLINKECKTSLDININKKKTFNSFLCCRKKRISLRESCDKVFEWHNLKLCSVQSLSEAMALLTFGDNNRHVYLYLYSVLDKKSWEKQKVAFTEKLVWIQT